jgi:hypothetical protein
MTDYSMDGMTNLRKLLVKDGTLFDHPEMSVFGQYTILVTNFKIFFTFFSI